MGGGGGTNFLISELGVQLGPQKCLTISEFSVYQNFFDLSPFFFSLSEKKERKKQKQLWLGPRVSLDYS